MVHIVFQFQCNCAVFLVPILIPYVLSLIFLLIMLSCNHSVIQNQCLLHVTVFSYQHNELMMYICVCISFTDMQIFPRYILLGCAVTPDLIFKFLVVLKNSYTSTQNGNISRCHSCIYIYEGHKMCWSFAPEWRIQIVSFEIYIVCIFYPGHSKYRSFELILWNVRY